MKIVDLFFKVKDAETDQTTRAVAAMPVISAVIFPKALSKIAKTFWQHTGEGISSRRAEYCHKAFNDGDLGDRASRCGSRNPHVRSHSYKGPRRYQRNLNEVPSPNMTKLVNGHDGKDHVQFVEERFGRNLDVSLASKAKLAIKRRIAGALTANVDLKEALEMDPPPTRNNQVEGFSEDDVYLYSCGMNSIFNTHRIMLACRGEMKSISFG